MGKRSSKKSVKMDKEVIESLRAFTGALSEKEESYREMLLDFLTDRPRNEAYWSRFLQNERKLLQNHNLSSNKLRSRLKLARLFLPRLTADLLEIELMQSVDEKRAAYGAMRSRGVRSAAL